MADTKPMPSMQPADANEQTLHHSSPRTRRKRSSGVGQLNLTSMIDVVFLLLIYFVITASFTEGEGILNAKLPRGTGEATKVEDIPKLKLTIELAPAGSHGVRIAVKGENAAPQSFTQLTDLITQLQYDPSRGLNGRYKPDDTPVIIAPKGQVRWQHVVNAFNSGVTARYENIAFAQAGAE